MDVFFLRTAYSLVSIQFPSIINVEDIGFDMGDISIVFIIQHTYDLWPDILLCFEKFS